MSESFKSVDNPQDSKNDIGSKEEKYTNVWHRKFPFQKGDMKHKLTEVTSFEVNYPEYREAYLKASFPVLQKVMKDKGINVELDALKGRLSVSTTSDTWDPYAILAARDVIKLLSRHVTIEKAVSVFDDDVTSEIISIKKMCRETETFVKRRKRLIGKDNSTIDMIQKLTKCFITVQGGTVAVIGPYKGVLKVMNVINDCMKNVHPLHFLNALRIQSLLMDDPTKQNEDWSHLIPNYKSKTQKKKKSKKIVRKEYNPLPPAPLESKLDQQLTEGEFFLKKGLKKRELSKQELKAKSVKIQKEKRAKQYIAPTEPVYKKRKLEETKDVDMDKLKKKVKLHRKKLNSAQSNESKVNKIKK